MLCVRSSLRWSLAASLLVGLSACNSIDGIIDPVLEQSDGAGNDGGVLDDGSLQDVNTSTPDVTVPRDDGGGDSTTGVTPEGGEDASDAGHDAGDAASDAARDAADAAPCTDQCTLGTSQCGTSGPETCETHGTCAAWVVTHSCGSHQSCQLGGDGGAPACVCAPTVCTAQGGTACQDNQTQATCAVDTDGCPYVASTTTCPATQTCSGATPSSACAVGCTSSCTVGQTECVPGGIATCALVGTCATYGAAVACPGAHQTCTGAAGSASCTCETDPTCQGATDYCANSATTLVSCTIDAQKCWYASGSSSCANGACTGVPGAAVCCTNACTAGTKQCGPSGGTETCAVQGTGCTGWNAEAACPSAHQTCSGPSGSASCVCNASACTSTTGLCPTTTSSATCSQDAQGCWVESAASACGASQVCSGGGCVTVAAPRQIAPLSTALVTSQKPTFHWILATGTTGAQVDICSTRACGTVLQTFTATGASGSPSTALGQGTYFWRLHGVLNGVVASGTSPVWQVRVGARSAAVDHSWGTIVDPNGDGFADVLVAAQAATTANFFASTGKSGVTTTPISLPVGGSTSVASAGDVNGDGFADVVVGWDSGGATSGSVSVYMGGPGGPATTAALTLIGPGGGGSTFGGAVASAGDIDGDGYADVVVGAKRDPNLNGIAVGAIYIYRGSASGLSSAPSARIQGAGYFGGSVASAGDVNGDGYADVIVGAPTASSNAGNAYVYLGSAAGLSSTNVVTYSGAASSSFGSSVSGADDLNGDGYADIIVGAPGSASGAAGAAFVYLGGASGLGTTAINPVSKLQNSNFGSSVAGAGDVNGDGFADVIVGGYSSTEACMYQGSATEVVPFGAFVGPVQLLTGGARFGIWVAGLGDVDGNGYSDVAVGGTDLATVFSGAAIGVSSTAVASLPGPSGGNDTCVE